MGSWNMGSWNMEVGIWEGQEERFIGKGEGDEYQEEYYNKKDTTGNDRGNG